MDDTHVTQKAVTFSLPHCHLQWAEQQCKAVRVPHSVSVAATQLPFHAKAVKDSKEMNGHGHSPIETIFMDSKI